MKKLTEADYARIRAEANAVRDGVMAARPPAPPLRAPVIKSVVTTTQRQTPPRTRPTYNRDEVVALYRQGARVGEIAEKLGAHRGTISRILKDTKVALRDDHGGPRQREKCGRGHSMEDALVIPSGGRACRDCKRERDRESARRRYWRAKNE